MTGSFVPHNFHTVGFGITGDRDATRLMANQLDEGVADTLERIGDTIVHFVCSLNW
jgi:hypothetical protein